MTETPSMVDWDYAVRIGSRLAGDGPEATADEMADVVAGLRADADRSTELVRDFTGLEARAGTAPLLVVDRPGWIRANAQGFEKILDPIMSTLAQKAAQKAAEKSAQKATDKGPMSNPVARVVGPKVTGTEVGVLLGFMGSRVLGQFDPFHDPTGRLLLVAPNIVHVQREIGADPADFRLWVCLHEETHRVQFTAVPWMRDHLFSEMQSLADTIEPQRMMEDGFKRVAETIKGGKGTGSLLDLVSTPAQREVMDRVTGVMSLLEGHADVVMDGVGPEVIPTVASIRNKFTQRRAGVGFLDKILRRLMGLDAKMAQYRDGAIFVRSVVDQVGMEGFNAVWAGPANLPTKREIETPGDWVKRVHG